jgi:RNA ligase (TIGR02306 family)
MLRKLVTVRSITGISDIEKADAIECAQVEGWSAVVRKNAFSVGDKCVYFEIDCFLPASDQRFESFMKNTQTWNEIKGCRIKTMKLRGQISQGLIMPLENFPEIQDIIRNLSTDEAREIDFSDVLKVEKWEAPIPKELMDSVIGAIPSEISKTEQERVQNIISIIRDDANEQYESTIKLDGNSMTVYHFNDRDGVCGRNWEYKETPNHPMWQVSRRNQLFKALNLYKRNIALQGEIIGEGIRKNKEKIKGKEFYLFNVFDIDSSAYLGKAERELVVSELIELGATIKHCPVIDVCPLIEIGNDIHSLLEYAVGASLNPKNKREGVVLKRLDGKRSFKVISNRYLLKNNE